MKYLIAFGAPCFAAMAAAITSQGQARDWFVIVVLGLAAGFGGLAGIGANTALKGRV